MANNTKKKGVGLAIDAGTTTLAFALVDLDTGGILKNISLPNPQKKWGDDVLSRVEAVVRDPLVLSSLQSSVVSAINSAIKGLGKREINEITVAGNSCMEHLLLGISPVSFSRVPFRPLFKEAKRFKAKDIGIDAPKSALYTFPLIGGFIGGDTVAAILALSLDKKKNALAIDIGTNSEIVLKAGSLLYAASSAAGPAVEGGSISSGMAAGKGAIAGVKITEDQLMLHVIGDVSPAGVCGSGLISAVSELLKAGMIDKSGRIKDKDEVSHNLSSRIKRFSEGNGFVLSRTAKKEIVLTQTDIRALQGAKAALRAGLDTLLKKAGIKPEDVEEVYLAGAFGSNLDKYDLETIGVLDVCWLERLSQTGDSALDGAVMALIDEGKKKEAEAIAETVGYVSLSGSPVFEKGFIRAMGF
ncbi:MAG: DUF4445 domain-containing protein [Deltaproteobacteria bacterium]|nr:DUF4445 domain-containing protein [Deltaproteobacteria bacterium]